MKSIKKDVLIKELYSFPLTVLAKKYGVTYVTFFNFIKRHFPDFKPKRGRPRKIEIEK